jgi:hypothetical protein
MKCNICGKADAQNFYGVGIFEHGTEISNARWGQNITAAKERARADARSFRVPGEFVYDVKVVVAHTRQEVVRAYAV